MAQDCGIVVCVFLKQSFYLIHVSHPPCLIHSCLHVFPLPFLRLHLGSSTFPSLLYPSMSSNTATPQGGSCLWLTEQSPLTEYETKSLIEVSSEHTDYLTVQKRHSTRTFDDLATTLDASEVYDTTDVGRLTSLLFSQEREVSATPLGVSCSKSRFVYCAGFSNGKGKNSVRTKRHSHSQSEFERREWKMRNADIALYETGMQLQSHRMYSGKSID